ncbi:MBL fold metallo-hydrolase [Neptunomonas japonica]|uniref:MBL fold metallo-hydrolase n=1 Tax=Neptunomonas japonica TaxID=417574 RepID=UPI0012EBE558|nr:MBL fold metallo-hydrolase [Neptunomonas japonica]
MMSPVVTPFFDEDTFTFSYVVHATDSTRCAIIDSVLNFDYSSGHTFTRSADAILKFIVENSLTVDWILETHVHADHLSASAYLQKKTGGRTGIGAHTPLVQRTFGDIFNAGKEFARDASQFDQVFNDQDLITIGSLEGKVIHTPGHTPACITYLFGNAAFVGDTLFMPDYGTARCDFPGGDAAHLYQSIQKIYALPDTTRLFMCHDYKAPGRNSYANQSSVSDQRLNNIHINAGTSEADFTAMRTARDKGLGTPQLMIPSVQVNMRAGHMPAEENGHTYLKVPINLL